MIKHTCIQHRLQPHGGLPALPLISSRALIEGSTKKALKSRAYIHNQAAKQKGRLTDTLRHLGVQQHCLRLTF